MRFCLFIGELLGLGVCAVESFSDGFDRHECKVARKPGTDKIIGSLSWWSILW
jgi:hypothetical protein